MPGMNRNRNSSERQGRGLGPCGAGQARRNGRRAGMENGFGQGMGTGRGNGMRRGFRNSISDDETYEQTLEARIAELEEENRRLREERQ